MDSTSRPGNEAERDDISTGLSADSATEAADAMFDITIIGAGPTGLFGAFYAGMRTMKAKIIDALPEPGGQLTRSIPGEIHLRCARPSQDRRKRSCTLAG